MSRSERGTQPLPEIVENGNIFEVDPAELMRNNPAALILNRESYDRMSAHFSPAQFDSPQVVRVITFSSKHGQITRLFVVDGLTRTRFAAEHKGIAVPEAPDFKFDAIPVKDVTGSLVQNPLIVPLTERVDNQQAISMLQYLRAVIPPTVEHSEIAPDRIASHLINGWENMVGEDLSQKYSALAALSLLENSRVPTATDNMLNKFLSEQNELMAGESADERVRLQQALLEMSSIIRQSKLIKEQVAKSAFGLVSAASPVIGGEQEARRQVYGLLHTPEVDRKLTESFTEVGERERVRTQLGNLISEKFKKFAERPDAQEALTSLHDSLRDPSLNMGRVSQVFEAEKPAESYSQIKAELNVQKMENYYRSSYRKEDLSPLEVVLIDQVGRKRFLNDSELLGLSRNISAAENVAHQAQGFMDKLSEGRATLLEQGVRAQTIEEATPLIQAAIEEIFEARSIAEIARRTTDLNAKMSEVERRLAHQMTAHRVSRMIDATFGDQLHSGRGPIIRRHALLYILREVDTGDNNAITRRLTELAGLDEDLQSQVLNSDIRISHAMRLQQQRRTSRRTPVSPTPTPPAAPTEQMQTQERVQVLETPVVREQQPVVETESTPQPQIQEVRATDAVVVPAINLEEQELIDREASEARRIELNNQKLEVGIKALREILHSVDLSQAELNPSNKANFDLLIKEIGHFRFGHPDIIRLIEDQPRLLGEISQLRAALINREEAEAAKDKLTGR